MAKKKRIYEVSSVYKVAGVAWIEATSAAEAVRIGLYGTEDGGDVQFDFSEPFAESRMQARLVHDDDAYVSEIKYPSSARLPDLDA